MLKAYQGSVVQVSDPNNKFFRTTLICRRNGLGCVFISVLEGLV